MADALALVLRRTRRRLRLQRALEALATTGLAWVLAATALVYLLKARVIAEPRFWAAQGTAAGLLLLLALGAALRRIAPEQVAKRIDQTHDLHDRIGTALEFRASDAPSDFMRAQIEDAARRAAGARPRRAAPIRWPRDIRPLGLLLLCLALVLALRFPMPRPPAAPQRSVPRLALDPDDLEAPRAMAAQLQKEATEREQPEIQRLAEELNKLFDQIERRELTRKELLAKLAELEQKHMRGLEGNFEDLLKKMKKMGEELQKEKLTRDLGQDLKDADLKQAKKDLEKLAQELQKLKEQEQKRLAKALDKAAKQKLEDQALQKKEELERQIRRLERQLKDQPKNELARRRLQRKQRELERLNREREQAAERQRELQRLNQDMQKAAQNLRDHLSPEAMKALQQAAQRMGRFADQLTKLDMMGKAQGQLTDLKELLRRMGQGQGQGQKGKQGKLQDFLVRAGGKRGGKDGKDGKDGQDGKDGKDGKDGAKTLALDPNGKDGTLVMPGTSPGQGMGQDTPNGLPGNGIGTSTDPNLMGRATNLKSQHQSVMVAGQDGKGPTRSEVILGAADRGFANRSYRRVYQDYTQIIEEVLKQEDVPLGYKYYVKRYFQLIKPR
jgi:hypothetical protein